MTNSPNNQRLHGQKLLEEWEQKRTERVWKADSIHEQLRTQLMMCPDYIKDTLLEMVHEVASDDVETFYRITLFPLLQAHHVVVAIRHRNSNEDEPDLWVSNEVAERWLSPDLDMNGVLDAMGRDTGVAFLSRDIHDDETASRTADFTLFIANRYDFWRSA